MALRLNKLTRKKSPLPELKTNRDTLLRGGGFVLLLLICFLHLRVAFLAQLAGNNSANALYFSSRLTDPDTLASLARQEFLGKANTSRALALYTRSLEHFILHTPSWLGLVELYNDKGETDKAVAALRFVDHFAANNEQTAWTKAMLAHELEQTDLMVANLVWLASTFPGKGRQVFSLADQRWPDTNEMMQLFAPGLYPDILEYYININDAPKAAIAWQRLAASGIGDQQIALRYVNYLLGLEQIADAARIWQENFRKDGPLLYNRELRQPLTGSGFGWRISKAAGVSWQPQDGSNGLRIQFDGSTNPSFSLLQIVPLTPGRYLLSGTASSQNLTTDQRPHWIVSGYKCDGLSVKGDMLAPTGAPAPFFLEFNVPDGCHAAQIQFRRSESYYFDNKISGTVTISNMDLTLAAPPPDPAVQPPAAKAPVALPPAGKKTGKGKSRIGINTMKIY